MTTVAVNIYLLLSIALALVVIALIVGAALALVIYERSQSRMARYQRTGRPEAPPVGNRSAVPGGEFHGVTVEREAQERAYANVIEKGAAHFMEIEPHLTLEQARVKAKNAINELGAFTHGASAR